MRDPNETVLILGGCRSGKSDFALSLADRYGGPGIFVATCEPRDEEMHDRVRRHKEERSGAWRTVEAPLRLPEAIQKHDRSGRVVLVDCLTLWVSNLLLESRSDRFPQRSFDKLLGVLGESKGPVLMVSNEIGLGVVPDNAVARRYRDLVGELNQHIASLANRVIMVTAGIPMVIKGGALE